MNPRRPADALLAVLLLFLFLLQATGAEPAPAFVIDGALDAGLTPVASCGGIDLYVEYQEDWLYVAVPAVAGVDRFVFIGFGAPAGAVYVPWAKAGLVPIFELCLCSEEASTYTEWRDENGLLGFGPLSASGAYVEGLINVRAWVSNPPPGVAWAVIGAYQTWDGGALVAQTPCSADSDGDIDPLETVAVPADPTGIHDGGSPAYTLRIHPNPFSESAAIRYTVPAGGAGVSLLVVDVAGRAIRCLVDGFVTEGGHEAAWNGRDGSGHPVPSGTYFCRLSMNGAVQSRKLVRLK